MELTLCLNHCDVSVSEKVDLPIHFITVAYTNVPPRSGLLEMDCSPAIVVKSGWFEFVPDLP